jgi:hypothetical protein
VAEVAAILNGHKVAWSKWPEKGQLNSGADSLKMRVISSYTALASRSICGLYFGWISPGPDQQVSGDPCCEIGGMPCQTPILLHSGEP